MTTLSQLGGGGPTDLALAIDIGGTKLAAALVTPDGALVSRLRVPTGSAVWPVLADLVRSVVGDVPVVGVGVGSAGPLDAGAGTVSPVNIPSWRGFPLLARLSALVPGVPVRLAGDGACAAAGEHWRGAGRGVDDLLVLVVSTGVGGGIIQNGRLVVGPTGNAGHIGHAVISIDGELCPCGGRGCVEAYASGPRMVAWALRNGWRPGYAVVSSGGADGGTVDRGTPVDGATDGGRADGGVARGSAWSDLGPSAAQSGPPVDGTSASAAVPGARWPASPLSATQPSAADLAASARAGDPVALAAFARASRALAAGIVSAAAICDLSRVVIGGGVAESADLLLPPLRAALLEHARLGFLRDFPVESASLGPNAGLIGAAALVFRPDVYPTPGALVAA